MVGAVAPACMPSCEAAGAGAAAAAAVEGWLERPGCLAGGLNIFYRSHNKRMSPHLDYH
jgi:hypothetical protein